MGKVGLQGGQDLQGRRIGRVVKSRKRNGVSVSIYQDRGGCHDAGEEQSKSAQVQGMVKSFYWPGGKSCGFRYKTPR